MSLRASSIAASTSSFVAYPACSIAVTLVPRLEILVVLVLVLVVLASISVLI